MIQVINDPSNKKALEFIHRKIHPKWRELRRISRLPRYQHSEVEINDHSTKIADGLSFYHSYVEIFVDGLYWFPSRQKKPFIIDCGSNIGLTLIYFKQTYPHSHIEAFEPDPEIFAILERNVLSHKLGNVVLHEKAIWSSELQLPFIREGADSGYLPSSAVPGSTTVSTARLRDYLVSQVDLLKIDIEGAEVDVMKDCADRLRNVHHLFVEYHSAVNEPQRLDELLMVFRESGFRYQIRTQFASSRPFQRWSTRNRFDLQLNIFAFRC